MLSCLLIRDFAAAVERRFNPALGEKPLVITSMGRVPRVIASSRQTRQMGVLPNMTVRQAQLLCPEAEVISANEDMYRRVAEELAETLLGGANQVEPEYLPTTTAFYLDTGSETQIIRQMAADFMQAPVTVGIATNKLTARVAAGCGDVVTVPDGEEAAFLAPQPVTLLPLSSDMARRLPLLGIDTLGQYAALPRLAAWEQFGKHGRWLHDLANGIDMRPIQPFVPAKRLCARQDFDDGIVQLEIVQVNLRHMAHTLAGQLVGEHARVLVLRLHLTNRHVLEHQARPQSPIGEPFALARRLDDLLGQMVITAPVAGVEVHLSDLQVPQPRQLSLFDELEAQRRLKVVLPDWVAQHRETAFYYSELAQTSAYALPEDSFTLRRVPGA